MHSPGLPVGPGWAGASRPQAPLGKGNPIPPSARGERKWRSSGKEGTADAGSRSSLGSPGEQWPRGWRDKLPLAPAPAPPGLPAWAWRAGGHHLASQPPGPWPPKRVSLERAPEKILEQGRPLLCSRATKVQSEALSCPGRVWGDRTQTEEGTQSAGGRNLGTPKPLESAPLEVTASDPGGGPGPRVGG